MELGAHDLVRLLRTLRGLSQRELSVRTGIPLIRIWRIERGVSRPRPREIRLLTDALISSHPAGSPAGGRQR
jgi:transcriptional regulator with XRE-family HTH domain